MTTALLAASAIGAGALGTLVRYLVSVWVEARRQAWAADENGTATTTLPLAVLVVNVIGSIIAGGVLGAVTDPALQLIVISGFCGGLTTFSTFSVETIQLVLSHRWRTALISVGANLILGIGGCAIAYLVFAAFTIG